MTARKLGGVLCALLVLAMVGLILIPGAEAQSSRRLPACDPDNGGLILPEGFCALVVADELEGARHLDITADGILYVHLRGSRGGEPNPPGGARRPSRYGCGHGWPGCFCSCRFWHGWGSINWSARPAIRARTWFRPMPRCSVC